MLPSGTEAGMIRLRERKKKEIGIMISPMIDMSFLLLVFFIVTTMNMSEVQTVPVQLPSASQTQVQQESRFNVAVRADGSLFLGTQPITREALLARAKEASAKDSRFSLVIYGDGRTAYQTILSLLDDCKAAGIVRVGLAAEKADAHGNP